MREIAKWSSVISGEGSFLDESYNKLMAHNRLAQYFIDSFHELGKITWPTKLRAVNICILVLGFVVVAAALIAGIDFAFHQGYAYLLTLAPTQ